MRVAHTRSGKPIPFILTVFPVCFYLALIGFGYYVFVVSICVRLLHNDRVALAVVLLVLYHITFIMMLWAYAMVILTDPGRVIPEHPQQETQQQIGQGGVQGDSSLHHQVEPHIQQGHPLWCSKCQHVKPERAHHCKVCKRCVLKMDHHCPWILNCVGQDNYKFFVLFVAYTSIHCVYLLIATIPLYLRFPDDTWSHQLEIAGMVIAGVFGIMLIVFTITHIRLILLNRTTIEDHSTPRTEGPLPCFYKGWAQSEGEENQGNERLYDVGLKENWQQAMGKGWKCLIPVRFPRPEGPIYNQKVVARMWKDYNQQMAAKNQQQEQQQQQQQPTTQQPGEDTAVGTARSSPPAHEVHHRANSGAHLQDDQSCT
ncbi:DHHC palmitoyltransferase-domain-containing protein [Gamsiella multidivaricata]|uniref:DHHC palmitoyltransferase-domain-containing protein n=1 Tax=Gamsiella multidivaricata TaxID=101098 RepID=UPI00222125DA|nr:DHHC palmitoyltransferase-domain-containing protein [Gamsiella multidivaricata]KAI7826866.1 DHHC palmitoyltransferase-domain-containing protein [Gamsiella multidivaricata]